MLFSLSFLLRYTVYKDYIIYIIICKPGNSQIKENRFLGSLDSKLKFIKVGR